jgi:glyoxylase-like metal-dependent hydrolase (beta-lactamase superfamily II)
VLGIRPVSEPERALARAGWEIVAPGITRVRLATFGVDVTVGAVLAGDLLVVVDAGSTPAEGRALRRALEGAYGRPVTDVVVTHAHFDHYGGAGALAGRDGRVWAHAALPAYVAAHAGHLVAEAVTYGVPREAAADAAGSLVALGAEEVTEVREIAPGVTLHPLGPAHSGHDLAVVAGGAGGRRVVFCGDLVESSGPPSAGPDATPALWPAAIDRLLAAGGPDAVYVPGHGPLVDAAFARAQRDGLRDGPGDGTGNEPADGVPD